MLKESKTYEQQIEILRENGCEITDEEFCRKVLKQVSYYRLSGYLLPYKNAKGKRKPDATFEKVYSLYEFDRKLRHLIFSVVEELEVYLRAQLSYLHTQKYGADGYMDSANFNNRCKHKRFLGRIKDAVNKNKKAPFIMHHINNYGGKFPLWVLTEIFTFGMLSYFYADMITADKKKIAFDSFNTTVTNAESWLYCCTYLRNLCAHYGRLYYRVFSAVPANLPYVKKSNENRLFAAIMALRELYPNELKWNYSFMPSMIKIFGEHYDVVELRHIGFPKKWENILRK